MLEIDGSVGQVVRQSNASVLQATLLPLLRERMVNLEHTKARCLVRVTVGEGVETCTKDHVLPYAARHCTSQLIFRKPAANDQVCAQAARHGIVVAEGIFTQLSLDFWTYRLQCSCRQPGFVGDHVEEPANTLYTRVVDVRINHGAVSHHVVANAMMIIPGRESLGAHSR